MIQLEFENAHKVSMGYDPDRVRVSLLKEYFAKPLEEETVDSSRRLLDD